MFKEEKTEAPTQRRLEEARKKGQTSRSIDFSAAAVMLACVVTLHSLAPKLSGELLTLIRKIWRPDALAAAASGDWHTSLSAAFQLSLALLTPFLVVTSVVAVASNLAQTGLVLSAYPLKPDFNRVNPIAGLGRLFSLQALVNLLKSLAKVVIIAVVLSSGLKGIIFELSRLYALELPIAARTIEELAYKLVLKALVAMMILGGLDFAYSKWSYYRNLRMTKQELKEEFKQTEGNPFLKSTLRSKQRALAKQRMAQEVPKADVVITNPTHYAIALKYDPDHQNAPQVVAKGADELAIKIRLLASKHSVPIVESPTLARKLYTSTEVGDLVPEPLLELVAEVYAYVCETDERLKRKLHLM